MVTDELVASGIGSFTAIGILTDRDSGPITKVAAAALGWWGGGQVYGVFFGPGSLPDSVQHPFEAVEKAASARGTLSQDAVTAGIAYTGYQGGKYAYTKYAAQGGTDTAEALEAGGVEEVGLGTEILTGLAEVAEFAPVLLL